MMGLMNTVYTFAEAAGAQPVTFIPKGLNAPTTFRAFSQRSLQSSVQLIPDRVNGNPRYVASDLDGRSCPYNRSGARLSSGVGAKQMHLLGENSIPALPLHTSHTFKNPAS